MDYVIVFIEGDLGLGRTINVGPNFDEACLILYAMLQDRGQEFSTEQIEDAIENNRILMLVGAGDDVTVEVGQLEVASYVG